MGTIAWLNQIKTVLEMLEEIQKIWWRFSKICLKAKDKDDPFRLMGFGHRVYKNFDPRAKLSKKRLMRYSNTLGVKILLDIAKN